MTLPCVAVPGSGCAQNPSAGWGNTFSDPDSSACVSTCAMKQIGSSAIKCTKFPPEECALVGD